MLEGFSFGVAIVIGGGQLNFAFGIENPELQKEYYKNLWWSITNSYTLNWVIFLPFLIFFVSLFSLMKFLPGRPWIILIAALGNLYGIITNVYLTGARPYLLQDKYPEMNAFGA